MNFTMTLATALLGAAAPAIAQSDSRAPASGKLSVVSSENLDGGKTIELRIDNGKISARMNGKEIPADRIRKEDNGRIVILDENGEELHDVHLFTGIGGDGEELRMQGVRGFQFNNQDGAQFWSGDEAGPAPKVMIGVHMAEPGEALEKHLKLERGKTAIITGVFQGLPADLAGIGEHDIIIRIDGSDSADAATIRKVLASKEPGEACKIRVIQAGEPRELTIKLQPYDQQKLSSAKLLGKEAGDQMWSRLGGPLHDMTIDLEGLQGLPELKDRVFVAPRDFATTKWLEQLHQIAPKIQDLDMGDLQPTIDQAIKEAIRAYQNAVKEQTDDEGEVGKDDDDAIESQLDRLDQRMAQLEQMLEKLIEKQSKP